MAEIIVSTFPVSVVAPDADDNNIAIQAPSDGVNILAIEVTAGTIAFCAGQVVTDVVNPTYATGEKLVITLHGNQKLFFKAAAQNDTFKVST